MKDEALLRFLRWFCPPDLYEGIEGDLLEQYEADAEEVGGRKALWRLRWNVLRFFRPGIVLRNSFSKGIINTIMFRSYLKTAVRSVMKRKLYSAINALGLSIGVAACLLIYLFVMNEKSFDQFHANKDLLYRLHGESYQPGENGKGTYGKSAVMSLALAPTAKAEIPEVQYTTHYVKRTEYFLHGDQAVKEDVAYVGPDFFKMFSFDLLAGQPAALFANNEEVVLTRQAAEKYFGNDALPGGPIGKTIRMGMGGEKPLLITGIVENPPANSSISFEMLLPVESMNNYNQRNLDMWLNQGFPTFIQLYPNAEPAVLSAKLDGLVEKYMQKDLEWWRQQTNAPENVEMYRMGFSKLTDIHLQKEISWEKVSDPQYAYILAGIAILILFIACINYVMLAMTSSAGRRKEVGVRKVAGARRKQLIWQFGFESTFLAFVAMLLGIALTFLFLPTFNDFTGKSISLSAGDAVPLLAFSIFLTLFIGFLAGSYPALFLSRLLPVLALRGGFATGIRATFARPLVVLQFSMSSFLIISSVIMYHQMNYMTTKDLGYDKEQVIVIPTQAGWVNNESNMVVERFRQLALARPEVISVAATDSPFGSDDYMIFGGYKVDGVPRSAYGFLVDEAFIPTMGIEVIQGRNFDAGLDAEETIIVNEALVEQLQWKDPLNERLNFHGSDPGRPGAKVVGVVKDFNFLSLEQKVEPMFLYVNKEASLWHIVVKIASGNIPATLQHLQEDFAQASPGKPFEYSFLDEKVAAQYAQYERWMNIMSLSTALAILIASLGLFGLAGINAVNRTKEVGIRKVMGAGAASMFVLLNKQYAGLAIIAFAVAAPASWYVMSKWLARFAYAIELGWELFAISMLAGLFIALAAVSYHTLKAASANPADSLRYE